MNVARAAAQIRLARPTSRLDEVVRFYCDGIGLERIGGFEDHDGYDGVMLGLPDHEVHLEFTERAADPPPPAPSADELLVFYLPDPGARSDAEERLARLGAEPVAAENPYWERIGARTFEDPDGRRVVIAPTPGI